MSPKDQTTTFWESAERTFRLEIDAVLKTFDALDPKEFERACTILLGATGHTLVSGVGKSGHIARKIASTLSSTGTPATFLHPSEAAHGDMGMVRAGDRIVIISKSGESDELNAILPALLQIALPIVAITSREQSKLAQAANASGGAVLKITVPEEACPNDLAPTASTTAALVLGDALAVALLEARRFTSNDFARLHPAGALGKRLTVCVRDLMASGAAVPIVTEETQLPAVMHEMSSKRFGATAVLDDEGRVTGMITDGDLRRFFEEREEVQMRQVLARDIMSRAPKIVHGEMLAIDALHFMEDAPPKVMQLLVLDDERRISGILHMHDIVRAGIGG